MRQVYNGLVVGLAICLGAGQLLAAEPGEHFDKVIAPLLAKRCLDCHQGPKPEGNLDLSQRAKALAGGDSGAAIVPEDWEHSPLWERIAAGEMPPKKPLPESERQIIQAWLKSGAAWGAEKIDPFRFTTSNRAGYDWWSLQPVVRPAIPQLNNAWPRHNAIDAFVQAKLLDAGLAPSPLATREVLARRLAFDLLGLPPSAAEIADISAERAPDALAQAIDRWLASPHYGERWARHWLDVIRFGESQGFERDKLRTNSWRYRDWVVNAFNRDLPYGDFIRLQIAGDVISPDNTEAIAATGFLVAGPYDEVGKQQQSAAMKLVVRQDELEDFVSVVGQSFLGLTVNCARCHDHKFDPILQREYYQLAAALAGVEHGERGLQLASGDTNNAVAGLQARQQQLSRQIAQRDETARQRVRALAKTPAKQLELAKTPAKQLELPKPLAEWNFDSDANDVIGQLGGELQGAARIANGRLVLDGKSAYFQSAPIPQDLASKTLVAWVQLANLQQRGGGVLGVQTLAGDRFDAIVFGELQPARWMAGSDFFRRTQDLNGADETTADQIIQIALVYAEDGTITAYRAGQPYGQPYKSAGLTKFERGTAQVVLGLRHAPAGDNRMLRGEIDRAQLYDRALTAAEIAALAGQGDYVPEKEILAQLSTAERQQRAAELFERTQLTDQILRWRDNKTYAVSPKQPHKVEVLGRGELNKPLGEVAAGGIASLQGVQADFQLASDAPDAQRRQQLAQWLADPRNPLAARVMVNRLWHYHFGVGLVDTPNDFGFNGGRPSHPELLDYLAAELIASGGSIKHVQRLIVNSATYQQASLPEAKATAQDADNRLLWRRSPQRLDAETIRDAMLVVSGNLNSEAGGPGFHDFRTFVHNSQFYEIVDAEGYTFDRRSLYRTWIRSGRSPLLDVFDCPDPSTKTPARTVTTTPLQALSLLNNSFVLRMSEATAQRVKHEAGDDLNQQVPHLYQLLFSRAPSREERKLTSLFVSEHGLAALVRVLVNSNEFLYID